MPERRSGLDASSTDGRARRVFRAAKLSFAPRCEGRALHIAALPRLRRSLVVADLNQIVVWITEIDRIHCATRARVNDRAQFNRHAMALEVAEPLSNRPVCHEAKIGRARRRPKRLGLKRFVLLVDIYLLRSEPQGGRSVR